MILYLCSLFALARLRCHKFHRDNTIIGICCIFETLPDLDGRNVIEAIQRGFVKLSKWCMI